MNAMTQHGPFHRNSFGMSRIARYCFFIPVLGSFGVAALLFPFTALWAVWSFLFAWLGSMLVSGLLEDKGRDPVRYTIGYEDHGAVKFVTAALHYLGHKTRRASDNSLVVDESFLVYVNRALDTSDIESARNTAKKEGVSPVFAVEDRFSKSHVSVSAYRLADKHDITIYDWNDVFDTVHEKIKSN